MENPNNTKPEERKQQNEKLLRLMTGYDQHASPVQPYTTNIVNVLIQMKADNKSDYTIHFTSKALTYLSQHTSLAEPEAVKMFIATLKVSDSYKKNLCIAYNRYCKHYKIEWNMPKYTRAGGLNN